MIEVTRKYAKAYVAAAKKAKGQMLDEFCQVSGLSRERARHLLVATGTRPANVARLDRRRTKPRKYSTDALEVLKRVWVLSGCECGPYLACDMALQLANLEARRSHRGAPCPLLLPSKSDPADLRLVACTAHGVKVGSSSSPLFRSPPE